MRELTVETYTKRMPYESSQQTSDAESEQKPDIPEILCNLGISCEESPRAISLAVEIKKEGAYLLRPSGLFE